MKDLDALLKAVAEGLEAMAEGIHSIAKKVDDLAKDQAPKKPAKAKPAAKKKAVAPSGKKTKKTKAVAQRLRLPLIRFLRLSRGQITGWITKPSLGRPVSIRNRCPVHCSG